MISSAKYRKSLAKYRISSGKFRILLALFKGYHWYTDRIYHPINIGYQ